MVALAMYAGLGNTIAYEHSELSRLHNFGFKLIPLSGTDGKKPSVEFANRRRLPLPLVIEKMEATGSKSFGLIAEGLVVVDVDEFDDQTVDRIIKLFGETEYWVKTLRGAHFYYKSSGVVPPATLKEFGIKGEIKSGANSYIVSPGSILPNSFEYKWQFADLRHLADLPSFSLPSKNIFQTSNVVSLPSGKVSIGTRNVHLFNKAISFAPLNDHYKELYDEVVAYAKIYLEDWEGFPESEIAKTCKQVWKYKEQGKLAFGQNSYVKTPFSETLVLGSVKGGGDASLMMQLLRQNFERPIAKPFPICGKAMAEAKIFGDWSKNRYYRAKDILIGEKLIIQVKQGGKSNGASLYLLNNSRVEGEGVLLLSSPIREQ